MTTEKQEPFVGVQPTGSAYGKANSDALGRMNGRAPFSEITAISTLVIGTNSLRQIRRRVRRPLTAATRAEIRKAIESLQEMC
ncbi:MAG: hypothetical protein JWL82_129 [Parcubacteria group bacterium]|nr:hypothetical protein [Parcubacteria group bacterium]